jgi:hypothetical protein
MPLNPTRAPFVSISFTFACVTAIVLVIGSACLAQVAGGTISGSVRDSPGRAIAGAQVAVKNSETAILRFVDTDREGIYTAPNLVLGTYAIRGSKEGFETVVRSGVLVVGGCFRVPLPFMTRGRSVQSNLSIRRFYGCMMPAMASPGQESESLNRQFLVASMPAMTHTARLDGYLDSFNKRWLEYLGVIMYDVFQWKWRAFVDREVERIVAKGRACLATGEKFGYETRVCGADGKYRWKPHCKVPLRDRRGKNFLPEVHQR